MSKWIVLPVLALAYLVGSAPASAPRDRDHDGLPDRWERRYDLSTTKKSGKADPDHDHLRNRREYRLRTNPRKRDTDGDGFDDRVEVREGTNPRDASSHPGFPNRSSTGVPAGWTPARTLTDDLSVTQPGAVVEDVLLRNADLIVSAPNVTIRRVKLQGGEIKIPIPCNGKSALIVDTTLEPAPGEDFVVESEGAIGPGNYTARRVEMWRRAEGFRVGGNSWNCGPVRIEDSFVSIADPPNAPELHPDGIQAYDGPPFTVVNTTIDFRKAPYGTAPFFAPANQGEHERDRRSPACHGRGLSVPPRCARQRFGP